MYTKIHAPSFGLALGVLWGLVLFILTLITINTTYTVEVLDLFYFYPGYDFSLQGAFIGLLWGFADGFVLGYLVIRLYNAFVKQKFPTQ